MPRYWIAEPWFADAATHDDVGSPGACVDFCCCSSPRAMAAGEVLKGVTSGRGLEMASPKDAKEARVSGVAVMVREEVVVVVGSGSVWTSIAVCLFVLFMCVVIIKA